MLIRYASLRWKVPRRKLATRRSRIKTMTSPAQARVMNRIVGACDAPIAS
jgi:hypothetical protein